MAALEEELTAVFRRFLHSGRFILGAEVEAFEAEFAAWCGARFAVGVGSGTEAITVALLSLGIGRGDEVVTVSHTAVPTVAAVVAAGATPVLVDIDEHCGLDPALIEPALTPRTKAILPVHLYGQPADLDGILSAAERHGLEVIEDCAQAHGTTWRGRRAGAFGCIGCFSFYPTKNLGALGDAGALITDDEGLAEEARRVRNIGQADRYHHVRHGLNCRLDELQAALLRVKLRRLDDWIASRRTLAADYTRRFSALHRFAPVERPGGEHGYHLYVVRSPRRDRLLNHLAKRGIGSLIHYPIPVHLQAGYRDLVRRGSDLESSERAASEVLSLPLYPELPLEHQEAVVEAVLDFFARGED